MPRTGAVVGEQLGPRLPAGRAVKLWNINNHVYVFCGYERAKKKKKEEEYLAGAGAGLGALRRAPAVGGGGGGAAIVPLGLRKKDKEMVYRFKKIFVYSNLYPIT